MISNTFMVLELFNYFFFIKYFEHIKKIYSKFTKFEKIIFNILIYPVMK